MSVMREILMSMSIGIVAGVIDVVPMIKKKLGKYAIISAFIHWVIMGIVIPRICLFGLSGWVKGALVALILSIPIVILVSENDKKSVPIIIATSIVLGGLVGLVSSLMGITVNL